MTIAERAAEALQILRRETDAFLSTIGLLSEEQWSGPSVCEPWSIRQLTAHLIRQVDAYIGSVKVGMSGQAGEPESRQARTERMNQIASQPPSKITSDFRETADQFERWFGDLTSQQLAIEGPHSHGPRSAEWFIEQRLMEMAYHRLDLDRSLGRGTTLDEGTARFILPTLLELNVPAIVKRDGRGGDGSYLLRVGGEAGDGWLLRFGPGALTTTRGSAGAAVTFTASAADLGLMMYGRTTWQALESSGKLAVSGDRATADRFHGQFGGP
ncbi:MAG: maleylpyruvate isomerase family mycothiol-dependent enzyme [Chloroflexota bacterium]